MTHMRSKIFAFLFIIFLTICFSSILGGKITPAQAADSSSGGAYTVNVSLPNKGSIDTSQGTGAIAQYIKGFYKFAMALAGILATLVIMIGGVIWLTAGGNTNRVESAKSWITGALTGLIIALSSYVLLYTINPSLVEFQTIQLGKPSLSESTKIGACEWDCMPNQCCKMTYEEDCKNQDPTAQWHKGKECPTPCCAWDQNWAATALDITSVNTSGLFQNCVDTDTQMTQTDCQGKPGYTEYMKDGQCQTKTLIGTDNTLKAYQCVSK